MQAYLHDMSAFNGDEPDASGTFPLSQYFDMYWTEETRYPFKIMTAGKLAGFALVREIEPGTHAIAEFFVLRKHRGKGVGKQAAFYLFDKFEGIWHVCQEKGNLPSQQFWIKIIGEYTDNNFEQSWSASQPRGPMQIFNSRSLNF